MKVEYEIHVPKPVVTPPATISFTLTMTVEEAEAFVRTQNSIYTSIPVGMRRMRAEVRQVQDAIWPTVSTAVARAIDKRA